MFLPEATCFFFELFDNTVTDPFPLASNRISVFSGTGFEFAIPYVKQITVCLYLI